MNHLTLIFQACKTIKMQKNSPAATPSQAPVKEYSIAPLDSCHSFAAESAVYEWSSPMERVYLIRKGIPYDAIDALSKTLKRPIKSLLLLFKLPQTTYNKKKAEHALLESRETELILLISELLTYGKEVFNNEEDKFLRWLAKPNTSLGGMAPDSLFDTTSGVNEVMACLQRIDYGNLS